jgi:type II secretory pathway predicted ATPase ExeA
MGLKETDGYIQAHLGWAGRRDRLFADDAVEAVHRASRGYPRAVNNLCVASMVAAYSKEKSMVDLSSAEAAVVESSD